MDLQARSHTLKEAQDLERALEAQYLADKAHPAPHHEQEQWRRVRRTAAERRFGLKRHSLPE